MIIKQFGISHIISLIIVLIFILLTIFYYKLIVKKINKLKFIRILTIILVLSELAIYINRFFYPTDINYIFKFFDLDICGFMIYAILIFSIKPTKFMYSFILLVGPFGAILALIFPNSMPFPDVKFFIFFITHGLMLLLTVFIFLTYNEYKLQFKDTVKVLLTIGVCAVLAMISNSIINSNFMFLNGSSGQATPLDLFSTVPVIRALEILPIFYLVLLLEEQIYKRIKK